MTRSLLALLLWPLLNAPAKAQDVHTRWVAQDESQLTAWMLGEALGAGEELLWSRVTREPDGAATLLVRGVTMEGERVSAVFERRHTAFDYRSEPAAESPPSSEAARCRQRLAACEDSARRCTEQVRRCLFGRRVLARGPDAELILEHPMTPSERRTGQRAAVLRWGAHTLAVTIPTHNRLDAPLAADPTPRLTVERLSPRRRLLVMETRDAGDEDPPRHRRYFLVRRNGLRELRDPVVASFAYNSGLPGNGTIVVAEDPWTSCARLDYPRRAPRSRVVVRVSDDGQVRSAHRQRRPGHWSCRDLPACPYVDRLIEGAPPRRWGEILRNVRHTPETQELRIGLAEASVRVRIAEEKPEVTYLDAVWLRVGDERFWPVACGDETANHCVLDGRTTRLEQGETLELSFDVPPALAGQPAFLVAHGMYVPQF